MSLHHEISEQLTQATADLEAVTSASSVEYVSELLNRKAALELLHEMATAEDAARADEEQEQEREHARLVNWINNLIKQQRTLPKKIEWETRHIDLYEYKVATVEQQQRHKKGIELSKWHLRRGRKEIREFERQHPEIVAELSDYQKHGAYFEAYFYAVETAYTREVVARSLRESILILSDN